VENHNYEIRKHVLEYDDVMNKQREVIYGDRRAILEGKFDTRAFMLQTLDAKVDEAIEHNAPENVHPGEWDLEEVVNQLDAIFPLKSRIKPEDFEKKDREEIRAMLRTMALEAYEAKEREVSPEVLRMVEARYLLLPIIDRQWVDHLYVMDHLKTGIGLRGYGQRDPRVEYEKEAFEIFESLKNNIADEAIKGVFRVVVEQAPPDGNLQPPPFVPAGSPQLVPVGAPNTASGAIPPPPVPQRPQRMHTNREDAEPTKPTHRDQPKVGRNDLCPCGSGKKYKKCHGTAA
jgi:preprotein translocase subunit SecA